MSEINIPDWLALDANGKRRRMMSLDENQKNEFQALVYQHPFKLIAAEAGLTLDALHKKCRRFGIVKPSRAGWFTPPPTNSSGYVIAPFDAPSDEPEAPEKEWGLELKFFKFKLLLILRKVLK
jgi:hypothetical protein